MKRKKSQLLPNLNVLCSEFYDFKGFSDVINISLDMSESTEVLRLLQNMHLSFSLVSLKYM